MQHKEMPEINGTIRHRAAKRYTDLRRIAYMVQFGVMAQDCWRTRAGHDVKESDIIS